MERILKFLIVLFIAAFSIVPVNAAVPTCKNTVMVPQNVKLAQCVKTFNTNFEKAFFLTETGINYYNYDIEEIQSKSGYIIFSIAQYKFLATVYTFGPNQAIVKITPCNNSYTFPPMVITNIFNYINQNQYKKF